MKTTETSKNQKFKNREYYQPFQIAQNVERLKFGNVERGILYAQHQSHRELIPMTMKIC